MSKTQARFGAPAGSASRDGSERASRARVMRSHLTAKPVTPVQPGLPRLAALVRAGRIERGISTRGLASRAAVARSTIQRLERGQLRPRRSLLSAVALGLDVDRQRELLAELVAAAGDAVTPESDGWRHYRRRRLERGILAGEVPLPTKVQQALDLHRAADALWVRQSEILDAPGAWDDARALDECLRLSAERRRLREQAGPPVLMYIGKRRISVGWGAP
jgi:transcriptional regulator with XRE-family HTH domain